MIIFGRVIIFFVVFFCFFFTVVFAAVESQRSSSAVSSSAAAAAAASIATSSCFSTQRPFARKGRLSGRSSVVADIVFSWYSCLWLRMLDLVFAAGSLTSSAVVVDDAAAAVDWWSCCCSFRKVVVGHGHLLALLLDPILVTSSMRAGRRSEQFTSYWLYYDTYVYCYWCAVFVFIFSSTGAPVRIFLSTRSTWCSVVPLHQCTVYRSSTVRWLKDWHKEHLEAEAT